MKIRVLAACAALSLVSAVASAQSNPLIGSGTSGCSGSGGGCTNVDGIGIIIAGAAGNTNIADPNGAAGDNPNGMGGPVRGIKEHDRRKHRGG